MVDREILLVPSAGLIPDELKLDLGPLPTGLVPLEGKPMLSKIAKRFDTLDVNVDYYVACDRNADQVKRYVDNEGNWWTPIEVSSDSIGETLSKSLDVITETENLDDSGLLINFADTIIDPIHVGPGTQIAYDTAIHPLRWTCFETDESGDVTEIVDKFINPGDRPTKVFTGYFRFDSPDDFVDCLDRSLASPSETLEPFYDALLTYLEDHPFEFYETDNWIDTGHLDTYYEAKKKLINAREFNEFTVDGTRNVLTKRSDNPDILVKEIQWYLKLPTQLQPYVPRVYDYSTSYADPYVKLEYIGYPSLSDLQLHGDHGIHLWNRVYDKLFELLEEFQKFTVSPDNGELLTARREMYVEKTKLRLGRLGEEFDLYSSGALSINGESRPALDDILVNLETTLAEAGVLNEDPFSVVHGDLCFANVMYDLRNGILKLVDARGEFGQFDIYGDFRYDLAKLRHSVAGNYEFLINGLFDVEVDPQSSSVSYEVATEDHHESRRELLDSRLAEEYPGTTGQVKLIGSLLFLSMVPLHADSIERQHCMLAIGIDKFDDAVGSL